MAIVPLLLLGYLVAGKVLIAATPYDSAAAAARANATLNLNDGDCVSVAMPIYPAVNTTDLDAKAGALSGSGWVGRAFVGDSSQAAQAMGGQIAAAGSTTTWVLSKDASSGVRTLVELHKIALPSGRTAWMSGQIVTTGSCL